MSIIVQVTVTDDRTIAKGNIQSLKAQGEVLKSYAEAYTDSSRRIGGEIRKLMAKVFQFVYGEDNEEWK